MTEYSPARGYTTVRTAVQLQPFWKREDRYAPEALAGTFAAKAIHPDAADKLVCALSKLICDGQLPGAAYGIHNALKKHSGPLSVRTVQVEYEYEGLGARRANAVLFHVLAPASVMDKILPAHTTGPKARPLPVHEIGVLQAALEKASSPELRPSYNHVTPEFWLGDLCEKQIGLSSSRLAPRILAAGVFDRENAAFASPDEDLIKRMHAVCEEFYPTPKVKTSEAIVQAQAQKPVERIFEPAL